MLSLLVSPWQSPAVQWPNATEAFNNIAYPTNPSPMMGLFAYFGVPYALLGILYRQHALLCNPVSAMCYVVFGTAYSPKNGRKDQSAGLKSQRGCTHYRGRLPGLANTH